MSWNSMGSEATGAVQSHAYRHDLDGLRGLAIALVVVFHIFVGRVSGGVDVFLLLSGYFFLGSQLRYAFKPDASLNPWWPIWRTARRLVPSLALVITATAAAAVFIVPEMLSEELTRQFTASMLYYQNWELMAQGADYSAASESTSPLQHLWSMAVQGQFYIAAIAMATIVALCTTRRWVSVKTAKRVSISVLALVTLASFMWASRHGIVGTPENYYSTFSRAWELSLGGLLAFIPATWALPQRFSNLGAAVGLGFIIATGIVISDSLVFPGPLSLMPLAGATLIILSGSDTHVSSGLASKPLRWLGDIAYPLYLWHWPLLIVATILGGFGTPPAWIGIIIVFASLALAHVTHQLVELPLKQHSKRPLAGDNALRSARESLNTPAGAARAAGGVVVASLVLVVLSVHPVWRSNVDKANRPLDPVSYPGAAVLLGADVPDVAPEPDPRLISGMYPQTGVDGCLIYIPQGPEEFPGPECVYGDVDSEVTIVLAGGSHVEPFIIPLDFLGKQHGFKVLPIMRQECPTVLEDDDLVSPVCAEWSRNAVGMIINLNPQLVISTSTRPLGGAGDAGMSVDIVPDSYRSLWGIYQANDIPFVGFRDNPWMFTGDGERLDPNECLVGGGSFDDCSMPIEDVYDPVDPAAEFLDGSNNQWSVDTATWYCPEGVCPPIVGNVFIYRDQNHISNAYAATLTPLIWNELQGILGELGIDYRP